jgi:hypothetical protein
MQGVARPQTQRMSVGKTRGIAEMRPENWEYQKGIGDRLRKFGERGCAIRDCKLPGSQF